VDFYEIRQVIEAVKTQSDDQELVTERLTPKRKQQVSKVVDRLGDYLVKQAIDENIYLDYPEDVAADLYGTADRETKREAAKIVKTLRSDLESAMEQIKKDTMKDLERKL